MGLPRGLGGGLRFLGGGGLGVKGGGLQFLGGGGLQILVSRHLGM